MKKVVLVLVYAAVALAASLYDGPYSMATAAILPVIAYFLPLSYSLPLVTILFGVTHFDSFVPITLGIPTLLATYSFSASRLKRSFADVGMHVLFPMCAIALFAFSRVGEAWPYSLYWLLPIICTFLPLGTFGRAVKSTFTAHAAGSLIWAYFKFLPKEKWLALIPVVAVERAIAVGVSLTCIFVLSALMRRSGRLSKKSAPTFSVPLSDI